MVLGTVALAGCSILPQRPYIERRDWPLTAPPPQGMPARRGGKVLLVRTLRAAPGLEARGLQILLPDGSAHTDYYEEWSVPPADAVEDALRRWMMASGAFAAVTAPGSRLPADYALEGELLSLIGDPQTGVSRISLALTLIDLHPAPIRVLLQADLRAQAPIEGGGAPAIAHAGQAALARLMLDAQRRIVNAATL